ncbi:hypothetical protein DLJ53_20770 [Acuticoccus sediminis]|uniref:Uncharacterized protein n=2 Tax=Acuticoccus sediminis TaxID=2184697 RepID=A0A8B2NKW4_9HYPH|nr:hypothetical protein DLJ53_20770 [Acuticoccus sediminis]
MFIVEDERPLEFVHLGRINGGEMSFWRIPSLPEACPAVDANSLVEIAGGLGDESAQAILEDLANNPDSILFAPTGRTVDGFPEVRPVASLSGAITLIGALNKAGFDTADLGDRYFSALFDALKSDILEGEPPADVASLELRALQRLTAEAIALQLRLDASPTDGEGAR